MAAEKKKGNRVEMKKSRGKEFTISEDNMKTERKVGKRHPGKEGGSKNENFTQTEKMVESRA